MSQGIVGVGKIREALPNFPRTPITEELDAWCQRAEAHHLDC